MKQASRVQYVQLMHAAFKEARPAGEKRHLATSIILPDVPDGACGLDGAIWKRPDFANASGYARRQHLLQAA